MIKNKFWLFDHYITSETSEVDHRQEILARMESKSTDLEKLDAIIDYMAEISPKRIEDSYQASSRVAKAK